MKIANISDFLNKFKLLIACQQSHFNNTKKLKNYGICILKKDLNARNVMQQKLDENFLVLMFLKLQMHTIECAKFHK